MTVQQNHNAGNMTNTRNTDIKKAKRKTSDHQLLHVVKDYDLIQCLNLIDCNNFVNLHQIKTNESNGRVCNKLRLQRSLQFPNQKGSPQIVRFQSITN